MPVYYVKNKLEFLIYTAPEVVNSGCITTQNQPLDCSLQPDKALQYLNIEHSLILTFTILLARATLHPSLLHTGL